VIRKIVLAFVVLFVLTWIILAHIAKSKLISFVNNSQTDNIKISYNDASVGGFPFGFTIRFASPKITITDQIIAREFSADYLNFVFNYKLSKSKLEFGKTLNYSTHSDEALFEYNLQSQNKMNVFVDFTKALFKVDSSHSLRQVLKDIEFNHPYILALTSSQEELFTLSNINFKMTNVSLQEPGALNLKITGDYNSSSNAHELKKASLFLESNYMVNERDINSDPNLNFDRKLEIVTAKMNLNDTSGDLKGWVELSRDNLPQGKISVELVRYDELVDIILPDDFIFSKPYVKKIIAKAAAIEFSNEISDKINFDINFTDQGVAFGRVNLLDLK
jgi:hypothetical protein